MWTLLQNQKKKTVAFCCDFFTAKFEWRPKKNKIFTPICANVIRLIEMKTKTKRLYSIWRLYWWWFYCTIFVLLCDIGYAFWAIFARHMKTKQLRTKKYFALTLHGGGGRWIVHKGWPNFNGGTLTTDKGTRPSYNLITGYISILGL